MSEFKKRSKLTWPVVPQEKDKKPPRTFEVRAVVMPGKTLTSKLIKPVGAALFLLALGLAHADTITVGAPQGGQGACPFPGCKSTAVGLDVTEPPYNVFPGPADMSGPIQMAIDSGAATLIFPAGTYTMCNVMPRAAAQRWLGAGIGQSILTGTSGCNNLVTTSFGGVFGGPTQELDLEGFTIQGGVQAQLALQCRDIERVTIRNNAFDTGGVGCPANASGPTGVSMTGCRDFVIEDNEFYSSCPGSGGRGILASGIRGGTIRRNTSNWSETFIEIGSTINQPTEFTNIESNVFHGTFWGIPTKFTNSGGTVTYAGSVLTDTAASFSGLCGGADSPPTACAAAAGNWMRVLTATTTGTAATFNTAGGYLTDASKNFTALGVRRGDIIRTTPVCFGNTPGNETSRFVCTGTAGTGKWGDSCVCTANADCQSGICEPRFATVDQIGTNTTIQVDEWVRDATCPLGAAQCPTSSRRPTGAILTTAGVAYTIFRWVGCQITSYTATTATCNADAWIDWLGSVATPANGTLYEIMYPRPLYNLLAGNNTSPTSTQGIRAVNNTAVGGFADQFELFGTQNVVIGNHSRDCADTCFVISGTKNTVTGNIADHCGARGMLLQSDDSTATANVAFDSPWVRTSNTTVLGDLCVTGSRNTFTGNKVLGVSPTNIARYGYVAFGTSTDNVFNGNSCAGTYSVGCYRFDSATSTLNHLLGYHGEVISNNAGTYSIEGGLTTFALANATAPLNGSFLGCTDCTPASPCVAGGGGGSILKRQTAAWNCP